MKKVLCIFLSVLMLLCVCPTAIASAAEKGKIHPYIPEVESYYPGVESYIASQVRSLKSSINISAFDVPKDDIIYVFKSAIFDNPDIFYVDASVVNFNYDTRTNSIETITPTYIFKKSEIPSCVEKFNSAAKKLVSGIDSSLNDVQKALILHDRLAVHCEYKNQNLKSFTAYSALVTKKSICEGYSRAYSHLLSLVGIDSKVINNESQAHCWNYVKLGGKWYHVDVTSDDPIPDSAGYVRHKFFLCSDSELSAKGTAEHKGYKYDVTYKSTYKCSDTKYKSSYFKSLESQVVSSNGALYYLNNNYKGKNQSAFIRRKGSTQKVIKLIKDKWYTKSGRTILDSFCRLAEKNGYIYFNTKRELYRYKISSRKLTKLHKLPSFIKKDFCGVKISGSSVYVSKMQGNSLKATDDKFAEISGSKATVIPYTQYSSASLEKKSTFTFKIYGGSGKTNFKSSNKKVAKVSSSGKIKALKKGACTVTATKSGYKFKLKIKVY